MKKAFKVLSVVNKNLNLPQSEKSTDYHLCPKHSKYLRVVWYCRKCKKKHISYVRSSSPNFSQKIMQSKAKKGESEY